MVVCLDRMCLISMQNDHCLHRISYEKVSEYPRYLLQMLNRSVNNVCVPCTYNV